MRKLGNIVSATKMFLNLLGNIFLLQGNIHGKHKVSATMFPSSPWALRLLEVVLPVLRGKYCFFNCSHYLKQSEMIFLNIIKAKTV